VFPSRSVDAAGEEIETRTYTRIALYTASACGKY
jgi:hypothetical protein